MVKKNYAEKTLKPIYLQNPNPKTNFLEIPNPKAWFLEAQTATTMEEN